MRFVLYNIYNFKDRVAMKILMIYLFLFIGLCLSSCQDEDTLYSCDPIVERWTNDNLSEISKMSRVSFLSLENDEYKRAAYRTFGIDKQRRFWMEKYKELKKMDWSDVEWRHIEQIYSLVLDEEKSILNALDLENDDELLKFIYHWQEYARETLGWSKKQIYAICYSVEKVINTQGDIELIYNPRSNNLTRSESDSGSGFECSCSQTSSYCDILDHEGPDYAYCRTPSGGGCKVTERGCGLFWSFSCNGMCLGLGV